MKSKIELQDFKQLSREIKAYFGMESLHDVAEALGYSYNSASSWYLRKRIPDRAVAAYYQMREQGIKPAPKEEEHADFRQLGREMKAFFGVNSLKEVAERLDFAPARANVWHNTKQFPDDVIAKFHQLRAQKQAQNPQKQGLFITSQTDTTPPPTARWLKEERQKGIALVAKIIQEAKEAHRFRTWDIMAEVIDVKVGTLKAYACGRSTGMPSVKFLKKLGRLADVSALSGLVKNPQELLNIPLEVRKKGHGDVNVRVVENLENSEELEGVKPPLLCVELKAKRGRNGLEVLGMHPNGAYLMARLKNDSMSPLMDAGDYMLIEQTQEARSGEVVVFEYGGEVFVKNMHKNPITGGAKFSSKNKDYPDFEITQGDEKLKMIGVVKGKFKLF
ncbi:S24 family peptidase [Helicobacter salomonis]|uniref:S24 family peptidase n=1 Tax=Helicobacter salomonis TaxID=56878 RepID=UPI00131522EB|nr:S24 family peptidase [Helicobacter salomonis]